MFGEVLLDRLLLVVGAGDFCGCVFYVRLALVGGVVLLGGVVDALTTGKVFIFTIPIL